ncbi:MAG: 3-deoxy-manno-octulosonate cytidylyltransferase [Acidobacteriota bacterium]|nr:3-deoxy-manno-octulosonate cytidylyltransferase [Acidobacteriota bacterium]
MVCALGVIPARYASSRFPGKPLASLGDKTLIEQVWTRVSAAARLERVIVATDDERIAEACRGFGAETRMTSAEHASGTDRVAEVAASAGASFDVVVNVQGDEPFVTSESVDRLVAAFDDESRLDMATLAEPLEDREALFDPNVVKVVRAYDGTALYFSRSPIPYFRAENGPGRDFGEALDSRPDGMAGFLKHQGIYAYRVAALMALARLPASPLERDEKLEQLRALQAGLRIKVLDSDFRSVGVDTPADLERATALFGETC